MNGINISSGMKGKDALIIGGVVLVVGTIGYFVIAKPLLEFVGLKDSKEDKEAKAALVNIKDYKGFDPQFYRFTKVSITDSRAKELAKQAYNAGGVFNDDEGAFYAVLTEAGSPDNLSRISHFFQTLYKQSLADWYAYYMDDNDEVMRIKNILNTYPN